MKLRALLGLSLLLAFSQGGFAQTAFDYNLPAGPYNANIQSPEQYFGVAPGTWHITHDQLVAYMRYLADASDRVTLTETGRTYEHRPLLLLTITSAENQANIDDIKQQHRKISDPNASGNLDLSGMPAVAYMGYSIHGNEASGSNAAPLVAYALAASQNPAIEEQLSNVVVLFDPSFNPDGLQRFSTWVNMHKSLTAPNPDPQDREHDEVWPGGRTNHYWFDLNRDWMPVQHPESQARIAQFQSWKPNVLIDAHEMGTDGTYFFQPGEETRNNPLTPENTYVLTDKIARYHAKALDKIGSLYYTREGFDDYYLGKGSSYPDVNGAVGILFEQASSRGHAQESDNGLLTFAFAINNHVTTSFSTLEATSELREELLEHQREFYQSAMREARQSGIKAYRFGTEKDPRRAQAMAQMLLRHGIDVHQVSDETPGTFVVPTTQPQYRFITGLFETRTTFEDSLFYDISTWTMPKAFGLPVEEVSTRDFNTNMLGSAVSEFTPHQGKLVNAPSDYAYTFETHGYYAHRALYRLMDAGLRVEVSAKPFGDGSHKFDYGTAVVPVQNQSLDGEAIYALMQTLATEDGIDVYGQATGYTPDIQLGSPSLEPLRLPKIAVLSGEGTSSYEVGEIWHLLDYRFGIPMTLLPTGNFGWADLDRYNVLVMPTGGYSFSASQIEKLKDWVREGGVLIGTRGATRWLSSQGFANTKFKSEDQDGPKGPLPYDMAQRYQGAQVIGGSIFNATIDRSHPLAYGLEGNSLSVFRNHTNFMEMAKNPYANPIRYTNQPLASGYISDDNLELLAGTAAAQVSRMGRGRVISLVDNPNFRAFWYGTNKVFLNSIFYGHFISGSTTE